MQGTFDPLLVTLSFIIAVAVAMTTLEVARRVAMTTGLQSNMWLGTGALSMGMGVWAMHFVGMLAHNTDMPYTYNIPITAASILIAIGASAYTIHIASRRSLRLRNNILGGCVLGAGIAGMHYTGMAAMEMSASISYEPLLVAASLVVAAVGSSIAIWIASSMAHSAQKDNIAIKVASALAMGASICAMHYTGMNAAIYIPDPNAIQAYPDQVGMTYMALTTGIVALIILGVTHLAIFHDTNLSAQKKLGKLAEQEAVQLSKLLDDSANEIYIFDRESMLTLKCNKRAAENLGYSQDQLLSMTPYDLVPGLTHERIMERSKPLLDGETGMAIFESVFRRADGTVYPINVHMQLSRSNDRPVYICIIADITEKKQLEKQMMQARKLESIGQLAAGIAHEINTPTQFVGDNIRFLRDSFSDLNKLLDAYRTLTLAARNGELTDASFDSVSAAVDRADPDYLTDEIPAAIEQSLEGISRVSTIVQAMKEFSHPGGKDKELVDLNKNIANTLMVASNEWKYVAEIVTHYADDAPPIPCHPQEISQVILNLIVNAAHAIAEKNGENSLEKGLITISTFHRRDRFEIRIEDNGNGIPHAIQERIFDPFFTTKGVGKGTGQGLAMAYSTIIDKHQGSLRLQSEPGQGTTFIISIPVIDKTVAELAEAT